jgi:hypothetical protein
MADVVMTVGVQAGHDADPSDVAVATDNLRRELIEFDDVEVAPMPGGVAPPGSRGIDPATVGGLLVTVANSQLFGRIVSAIRTWLGAQPERSITLEIDGDSLVLTGVTSEDQIRLADEWFARHAPG